MVNWTETTVNQQPEMPGAPASAFHASSSQQAPHLHPQPQEQEHQLLQAFWAERVMEIQLATNFKRHSLPLARVKKVMKAEGEANMVSSEAPVVLAKACELLIQELAMRAWTNAVANWQTNIGKDDVVAAITRTDVFDFLVNTVPNEVLIEQGIRIPGAAESAPYSYDPGMFMGMGTDQAAEMYNAYMPWQLSQPQMTHVTAAPQPLGGYAAWQFSQLMNMSVAPQPRPGDYMSWQFSQPHPISASSQASVEAYAPWQFLPPQPTQQQQPPSDG